VYRKSQCNVSQSERKSTILTSEFRNCKIRAFFSQKMKEKGRVCKKHKKVLENFLTNLISEPMISENFENGKA
jgi:hypothetical protein